MFMQALTLVAFLGAAGGSDTEIYTYVDETGQVHYTDEWVEGCEKVELPGHPKPATPPRPATAPKSSAAATAKPEVGEEPEEPIYKSLSVVSPAEDECLRRIGGIVKVLINVDPKPRKNRLLQEPAHRLLVTIDGQRMDSEFVVGMEDGLLALFMTEVYRGTHTLQIAIEDESGEQLIQSPLINFHVQQISKIQLERMRRQRVRPPVPPPRN
jgi:hypothetical protein